MKTDIHHREDERADILSVWIPGLSPEWHAFTALFDQRASRAFILLVGVAVASIGCHSGLRPGIHFRQDVTFRTCSLSIAKRLQLTSFNAFFHSSQKNQIILQPTYFNNARCLRR
jgi:hypothetical protein